MRSINKVNVSKIIFSAIILLFFFNCNDINNGNIHRKSIDNDTLRRTWKNFSGNKSGKVIYASPPDLIILYLHTGEKIRMENVVVEGGKGRWKRGKTPRPFWSPDGNFFVFRNKGKVFRGDESGTISIIDNPLMDTSKETRWSVIYYKDDYYTFGPSVKGKGIAVKINNPSTSFIIFNFPIIDKHCELTGDLKHIVYAADRDIYLADIESRNKGIKISFGQSCRPCASPSEYVAWLPAPHIKYNLHSSKNGKLVKILKAPENEEIYRLNWSNKEEYAVHMFGSRGNTKMYVRKISTGESLFIGNGWDPDLWIGDNQ